MSIAKQIHDYPDYYVSSAGNVWREKSNDFYLKLKPSNRGQVQLCTNGEKKQMYIYRIVAQAFVPIPEKYTGIPIEELDIHHINFNRNDNRASNLMWLTKAEHQQLHRESEVTSMRKSEAKKGKPKSEEHKRKLIEAKKEQSKAVAQYTKNGEFVAEYASIREAERLTKVNRGNICSCCSGRYNSAGGYVWKYVQQ